MLLISPYSDSVSLRFLRFLRIKLATYNKLVGSFFNRNAVTQNLRPELRLLVSTRFQILFHRPPGLLFTFPSRYLFTIGRQKCLALPDSPGRFPLAFTRRVVLGNTYDRLADYFRIRGFHPLWQAFPDPSPKNPPLCMQGSAHIYIRPATPRKPIARSPSLIT